MTRSAYQIRPHAEPGRDRPTAMADGAGRGQTAAHPTCYTHPQPDHASGSGHWSMITFSLQSGSNGNAIYVEADGVRLLFDAGISGRQAAERMRHYRRDIRDVDALIISHIHADHAQCAGIYHRKFGLPIHMTRTANLFARHMLGRVNTVHQFCPGDPLAFGQVTVHTIPTPHDAADSVAFVVECGGKRLGIFTDVGRPFDGLLRALPMARWSGGYEHQRQRKFRLPVRPGSQRAEDGRLRLVRPHW